MLFTGSAATVDAENADGDETLDFALIGDMPYNAQQRTEFVKLMAAINAEDLAFVVHDGDLWFDGIAWKETSKGLPPCSDAVFEDRLDLAQSSEHPFVFTPGDNDWTDCYRAKPRTYDPLERLAKLREMFFQGDRSLGERGMKLTRQSEKAEYEKFRENVRWTYGGVQFVTLHMTGSDNDRGHSPGMDAEFEERNAANLVWMQEAFEQAKDNDSSALMIISQANPQFENTWSGLLQKRYLLKGLGIKPLEVRRVTAFDQFLEELEKQTLSFEKPVVFVHGDTHTFRIDKPLVRSPDGMRFIEKFTRVETFGYPNTHWIRVTIDPNDPNVFRFRQEIVKANMVMD
jgi:hypothetical protein